MKRSAKLVMVTSLAAVIVAGATAAFGHGEATGIVKERMDAMIALRDAAKALGGMMKGATPYDADAVKVHAATISAHAGESLIKLFPEGTGGMPSEARDEIWTNWNEFSALSDRLKLLADGLAEAADNGLMTDMGSHTMDHGAMDDPAMVAAMPADAVFLMIGQTCSACHEQFRLKN